MRRPIARALTGALALTAAAAVATARRRPAPAAADSVVVGRLAGAGRGQSLGRGAVQP